MNARGYMATAGFKPGEGAPARGTRPHCGAAVVGQAEDAEVRGRSRSASAGGGRGYGRACVADPDHSDKGEQLLSRPGNTPLTFVVQ